MPRCTVLLTLALLAGCNGSPFPSLSGTGSPAGETPSDVAADAPARVENGVVLRAVGPYLVGTTQIVAHTPPDLFYDGQVGGPAPEGTQLTITPPIEGTFVVTDRDTLTFKPQGAFEPGVKYAVQLVSLSNGTKTIAPPPEGWRTEFEMPAFAFARLGLREHDIDDGRVDVEVLFNNAVDAEEVAKHATFTFQGQAVKPVRIFAGDDPWSVRAVFQGREYREAGELRVAISEGVPYVGNPQLKAAAGESKLDVKPGEPLEILKMSVQEGANGFYIDVVCRDKAVKTTRYYWDRTTYEDFEISTRCQLSEEEAQRTIHLEPSTEVTVAAAPGGFRIFAPFERGTYKVRIDAGAATVDGGVLQQAYEAEIVVPQRSALISFGNSGRYLPRNAWHNLPVRHRNVDVVDLEIRHIPEENLVFWMTNYGESVDSNEGDLVLKKTISLAGKIDEESTTWVDVGGYLPDIERGVYEVRLKAKVKADESEDEQTQDTGWRPSNIEDGWRIVTTSTSRLMLTDMHLIAKMSEPTAEAAYTPQVRVWAIDVHTNQPVAGADVRLVRASGKIMGSCRSSADGGCVIDVTEDLVDKSPPIALLARKGDDLTYMKFDELQVDTTADVTGESWTTTSPYRAAVYGDRGVYRPGDTLHLAAVIRDRENDAPEANLPAVLRVFDPSNKAFKKVLLTSNDAGMVTYDVKFGDYASTGGYRAQLEVAERVIGRFEFNVEEFVPERMKVDAVAKTPQGSLRTEPVAVGVDAQWLFGGSAEGSSVEVTCQLEPAPFTAPGRATYAFGPSNLDETPHSVTLGTTTATLDAAGHADVTCPAPSKNGGFSGPASVVANVLVFEGESGRSTRASVAAPVHPDRFYVGLDAPRHQLNRQGSTTVSGIIVDWAGKASPQATATVDLEVVRLDREYGWMWDSESGSAEYRQMHRLAREMQKTVPVSASGEFTLSFEPSDRNADYMVVAKAGDTRTELIVEGSGYYGWWASSEDTTPRPERPSEIKIEAPQVVQVGESGHVKLIAPYDGRMLISLETDKVLSSKWMDVKEGPVEWDFAVENFVPNAYVTALIVKNPHGESATAFLPDRAFGAVSVRVEPKQYRQDLKISVPAEVKPNSELTVSLDLGPQSDPTYVTIAAVDAGILSLTDFPDPDPLATIFARRRLGVRSFETVGWTVAMPAMGPSSHTGGDTAGGDSPRVQMVKPVALWSGLVAVDAQGKASVKFNVPGYRGKLHIMAVSASKTRMGSASADVTVRDPLTLQTTLPRFMIGDDSAKIPVMLTNMSGKTREITVHVDANELPTPGRSAPIGKQNAPLVFANGQDKKITLENGKSGTVVFDVTATRAPTAVGIRVTAKSGELESFDQLEMPIQTALPEQTRVTKYPLKPGVVDLDPLLDGWVPGSERANYWVTSNPYAQSFGHLGWLVHYPHGCIEQTTSATRPLLYAGSILKETNPEALEGRPVDAMVSSGIDRVLSMQTPSGAFAYWPGGTSPERWGTAYATHLLLDAKKAGYAVPQTAIDDAVAWLDKDANRISNDGAASRSDAYMLYVLAVAGKPHLGQTRNLLINVDKDPTLALSEERYLLMAALWQSGDHRFEKQLKSPNISPLSSFRTWDSSYYSDLRGRGLMLATFHDLFGNDPAGEPLAAVVAAGIADRESYYYTTQELAWGITGLGKWLGTSQPSTIDKAALLIDGKPGTPIDGKSKVGFSYSVNHASLADTLTLDVNYSGDRPVWLVQSVTGTRAVDDLPYGGNGLGLTRQILDGKGVPVNLGKIELGDALYVRLTIENKSGSSIDNLALVDRLPAGFEVENTRLGQGITPDWVVLEDQWSAEHLDLRDDRIAVFGDLYDGQTVQVVYGVRAVTAGSFTEPEAYLEAMYDPRLWARQKGDGVTIVGPW